MQVGEQSSSNNLSFNSNSETQSEHNNDVTLLSSNSKENGKIGKNRIGPLDGLFSKMVSSNLHAVNQSNKSMLSNSKSFFNKNLSLTGSSDLQNMSDKLLNTDSAATPCITSDDCEEPTASNLDSTDVIGVQPTASDKHSTDDTSVQPFIKKFRIDSKDLSENVFSDTSNSSFNSDFTSDSLPFSNISSIEQSSCQLSEKRRGLHSVTSSKLLMSLQKHKTEINLGNKRNNILFDTDEAKSVLQSVVVDEDSIRCDECGKVVSVWEMPEHNDYHYAKKLQQDERLHLVQQSATSSSSSSRISNCSTIPAKDKNNKVNKTSKQMSNIAKYFQKS